ncbi:hypothetical protein Trydic_g20608 [Trypoxylus dichotomus]
MKVSPLQICLVYTCLMLDLQVESIPRYNYQTKTCGYQSCTPSDPNQINVHIVPHSHDDVGWVKTFDQYYDEDVRSIINSVVQALAANPERRFVQVETAFFHKWWKEQDEQQRALFKELVDSGRLEIANGAWSMNDEATSHYQSIIDQFTLGLRTLNDTLGKCSRPRIGWQIDPFGHSKEMAAIYSQMGFDGVFLGRIDYRDKSKRIESQTMEMLWKGGANLDGNSYLFTSVLYNHYDSPTRFCFDCGEVIIDSNSYSWNYAARITEFANIVNLQAQTYKTNNIMIVLGGDFQYRNAETNFLMTDTLIRGFEQFSKYVVDKRIRLFYSTPSCYLKAVNEEAMTRNLTFPLKVDDFFPYASDENAYWVGYYTSRPTSKRYERQGNNILQVTKQLTSFVRQAKEYIPELRELQEAMGVMQHHDAISGTEKQVVADDYHTILSKAIAMSIEKDNEILSSLLSSSSLNNENLRLKTCLLANISVCPISQSNQFIAVVYNPLSRPVSHYVRLPVNSVRIKVKGPEDELIPSQILPAIDRFKYYKQFDTAPFDLVFLAENIPPLGAKLFKVTAIKRESVKLRPSVGNDQFKIGGKINNVEVDEATKLIKAITLNETTLEIEQSLMYYIGKRGSNVINVYRASGAYVFRPRDQNALSFTDPIKIKTFTGDLVDEIHQTFSNWAKQVIRLYKNTNYVEFDWLVGPIPTTHHRSREVISRFTTSLQTDDIFFTDANGRQMIPRRRNYRATFEYTPEEPTAGNYYPVTSKISMIDANENVNFAVLTDRAQGGTSLKSGEIELMVHRNLLDDDGFGVNEPLNEMQFGVGLIARGKHYVTFGPNIAKEGWTSAAIQKDIAKQLQLAPWIFLTKSVRLWDSVIKEFSGLTRSLPKNVQILTLEPWKNSESSLLLRLEHVFEEIEDPILSRNAYVDLEGLFTFFDVMEIYETTLDGNQPLTESERLQWIVRPLLRKFRKFPNRKKEDFQVSAPKETTAKIWYVIYADNKSTGDPNALFKNKPDTVQFSSSLA